MGNLQFHKTTEEARDTAPTPTHSRRWGVALAFVFLILAAAGWRYWPHEPCFEPSCAVRRFSVAVEIDALGRVSPISFEITAEDETHSLQSILRSGGLEVSLNVDQVSLPYDPSSGALDRADLYQLVTAWRTQLDAPNADARLYALFTAGLISDNGEPLFGIMFDTAGREGFAVAPRTTERFFGAREPEAVAALQLRTFTHELLHALNRQHSDAVTMQDGRLTLEAPTRCISDTKQRDWSLREQPLMALSPTTIQFFQTGRPAVVLPGPGNAPFRNQRTSPTECDDARMRAPPQPKPFWERAAMHLRAGLGIESASAAEDTEPQIDADADLAADVRTEPPVELRLQAQPSAYPLGYPIAVRVQARNDTDEALPLLDRLNPAYGMLRIEVRRETESEWRTLEPTSWFEPSSDEEAMLNPQEQFEETIPIYFGEAGWTFPDPGQYVIRAQLKISDGTPEVLSPPVEVRIEAPRTPEDRAALQPLLNEDGELDPGVGRLLSFGGRIGRAQDLARVEQVAKEFGHTAIGGALHLTLLSHRLRRPIDPATGIRAAPDLTDARELLDDTCTDSGIAALTSDLLDQRPEGEALPDSLRRRIQSEALAWEGRSSLPTDGVIATYSNPRLHAWGPSIHFCFNEDSLQGSVRREVNSLARQLKLEQPARVVVVGHGDQAGTCRYNDELAQRRAQVVQRALLGVGIERDRIAVVTLGERRPLDFAASEDAQAANRRVEILIEGIDLATERAPSQRIIPQCAPRP
jgi:outer membrane protein OmpA-like peptidoglycan-associated protein